jgi:hypothetical protein
MTEASQEISRHRVKAADTGLRADRQSDTPSYSAQHDLSIAANPGAVFDTEL